MLDSEHISHHANARHWPNPDSIKKAGIKMNIGYNGIWGLLILIGDIWAIINILQSSASKGKKLLWILLVLLLPLLGLILWFFLGPRDGKT
jgi:succinate dehydrogenase/fumarate reductase cytochrome b subunit